jgi:methionine aminopeptidase
LRTTVYKRDLNRNYNLKSKASRSFFNEVMNRFPALCFSMRAFEDEISAKIGVKECIEHDLLNEYPVLSEKQGDIVAHFKYTVLITSGSTI